MQVRVVTLRYDNETQGFNDEPLRQATYHQEILSEEHHLMTIGNVPHITFILTLVGGARGGRFGASGDRSSLDRGSTRSKILEGQMGEPAKKAYAALKKWRNDIIRGTGAPSYEIARNHQLAEMALRAPKTLIELREVKGIGDAFTKKYGADVLKLLEGVEPTSFSDPDSEAEGAEKQSADETSAQDEATKGEGLIKEQL